MNYKVALSPAAERQLRRLKGATYERLTSALLQLTDAPRPHGSVKLSGSQNDWRIRVGDYRILYEIDDEQQRVTVWRIAHRREVYR